MKISNNLIFSEYIYCKEKSSLLSKLDIIGEETYEFYKIHIFNINICREYKHRISMLKTI